MLKRVVPGLMGMRRILALNEEAHHCYREKPVGEDDEGPLKGDDRKEAVAEPRGGAGLDRRARGGAAAARLQRVIDLSATPFFLRGSGYRAGTLFPWTTSDFSLMDAIESGIVKLPRVPVADNIPDGEKPRFRNLWEHIRPKMPKRGRGKAGGLDPVSLPVELQTGSSRVCCVSAHPAWCVDVIAAPLRPDGGLYSWLAADGGGAGKCDGRVRRSLAWGPSRQTRSRRRP